jgi:hypothetical protein
LNKRHKAITRHTVGAVSSSSWLMVTSLLILFFMFRLYLMWSVINGTCGPFYEFWLTTQNSLNPYFMFYLNFALIGLWAALEFSLVFFKLKQAKPGDKLIYTLIIGCVLCLLYVFNAKWEAMAFGRYQDTITYTQKQLDDWQVTKPIKFNRSWGYYFRHKRCLDPDFSQKIETREGYEEERKLFYQNKVVTHE